MGLQRSVRAATLLLLAGCSHSDPFVNEVPAVAPPAASADMRLTFNSDQDYWPMWTQDGRGILYSFVDPEGTLLHRCIGLLPPAGGTRLWQLCDNRATQGDSASMFSGYALDTTGRVLYAQVESSSKLLAISRTTLWLADTATPFARTALLTLPIGNVSWLTDIRWTGPTTFIALGQLFETLAHCFPNDHPTCSQQDSIFVGGGAVMTGTISGAQASLAPIGGTTGATSYSLAENGASIVFTLAGDLNVYKVAVAGGTAIAVAAISQGPPAELLGVSCKASTCVVATAPVSLTNPNAPAAPRLLPGTASIASVSLASGATQVLVSNSSNQPTIYSTPQLSPVSGDVVAQFGGTWWGHLQTFFGGGNADLHLYPGLLH